MISVEERINNDLKEAMKNKDAPKLSVLRTLKAAAKNLAIEKKVEKLEEGDYLKVIGKQIKQIKESIEAFEKGKRADLVEKEKYDLEVLSVYIPEQLSEDEIKNLVKNIIIKIEAKGKSDFGKVMREAMKEIGGKADGKLVNKIISNELG
ncbi:MAG: GatB/YqeY domain-containing protein [bacterium]|nr:GatB/YqeY domain-containing protein [bacterium]